jgi:hypothetical protein
VYHWCEEVSRIVDEYGVKELQNVLPLITDSLFELHIQVYSYFFVFYFQCALCSSVVDFRDTVRMEFENLDKSQ